MLLLKTFADSTDSISVTPVFGKPTVGAGVGATKEGKMAPGFSYATPDRALRFSTISAVNRQAVGSNPTRGANFPFVSQLGTARTFGVPPKGW